MIARGGEFRRRTTMAKQITCMDAGLNCPGQFKVETEDELMQHIQIHAKAAHPDLPMTPEFQRQVKSLIKTV
jgi:predicted small metal-binding protein